MTSEIPRRAALVALAILFTANLFSYLDRQLVSALEEPITHALSLSQTEFGLLWTLFTLGYMTFALPIGRLADRGNRPLILAACIVIWSGATVASGLATAKWVLYVSRFFIGVGEAGCLVIGQALISDLFPARQRGRALSAFHLAVPLGGTAAFILAGALENVIDWRTLFYLAGLPGVLIAAAILKIEDIPHHREPDEHGVVQKVRASADYRELARTPTLMFIILAQAFAVILLVPLIHFGAKFVSDRVGIPDNEAKVGMGLMALFSGGTATVLSGFIGDWLTKRHPGGYALLAGVSFLAALPFMMIGFQSTDPWVALPALAVGSFFVFACMPAVNAQVATVTHPWQRATAWSMSVFLLHLMGDTTAPVAFGWVSQNLGRLRAFELFSVALLLAGVSALMAARSAPRDVERLNEA